MMPPLTMFQQLLMQGRGTAPQQGQPQAPQPAPQPQPAAAKPSRLDGLLRRYDQFATGGADPSTLNPQQRSLMRRQLAMNIGGAIQQGQPIAAGVSAHGANLAAQQEAQLKQREAQAAAARQQAVQAVFAQRGAASGGQMPLGGQGAEGSEPLSGQALRMAQREQAVAQYRALLAAGAFEEADKFSEQVSRMFPEVDLTQVNTGNAVQMVDPLTGAPVATYDTNMTDYQAQRLGLQRQKLAMDAANGGGGPGGPPEIITVDGERFWRRGNNWERIPTGAGGGSGAGGDAAGDGTLNDRQLTGAAMVRNNVYSYVSAATGVPESELADMTPTEVEQVLLKKGRRTLSGPILGNIPLLSNAANADLLPYAVGAGSGQAMVNNPTGPITLPDFAAGEKMQPNPKQPLSTQANLVRIALEQAGGGVGNLPAPNAAPVRKRALDASGKQVTFELVNGAWQVVQ